MHPVEGFHSDKSEELQDELFKIPTPCDYIKSEIEKGSITNDDFYLDIIGLIPENSEDYQQYKCLEEISNNITIIRVETYQELEEAIKTQNPDNSWTKSKQSPEKTEDPEDKEPDGGTTINKFYIIIPIDLVSGLGITALLRPVRNFIGNTLINVGNALVKTGESLKKDKENEDNQIDKSQ